MNQDDFRDKTQELQREAEQTSENIKSKAQETVRDFREAAADWQKRAMETTRRAARAADDYVHNSPWKVLGPTALGCFLLGYIIGRRSD